jgi:protein-L-isoaspartate O-methyltransferase
MSAVIDQTFHAPAEFDLIDRLIAERDASLDRVREIHGLIQGDGYRDAVGYFLGADKDRRYSYTRQVDEVFDLDPATKYLDACFWKRALAATDVYECMPQARKDEWNESIEKRETPEFTDANVRSTIGDLLLSRGRFIAEKADGVFRRLSRTHVTNAPEGFRKRFILDYCFSFGSAESSAAGYLNDLREIIARYMRRDLPSWNDSARAMDYAKQHRRGQWVDLDGGALKIRCYLKGTMHVEVHPHLAWKLNLLLHELYPAAIPSKFREPPKRTKKLPEVHDRPLSFACIGVLRDGMCRDGHWMKPYDPPKAALAEAIAVIEQLGGVRDGNQWTFDYDPTDALHEVIASGVVPDKVAHQFYPTPEPIARAMVEAADLQPGQWVLEPSAGTGSLVRVIFETNAVCAVEISSIHCKALTGPDQMAETVDQADFMEWKSDEPFERIVMNPPYSEGRALAHVEKALTHLAPGGRLVALLPATYQKRDMPGGGHWLQEFDRFPGTSISVAIYVVENPA